MWTFNLSSKTKPRLLDDVSVINDWTSTRIWKVLERDDECVVNKSNGRRKKNFYNELYHHQKSPTNRWKAKGKWKVKFPSRSLILLSNQRPFVRCYINQLLPTSSLLVSFVALCVRFHNLEKEPTACWFTRSLARTFTCNHFRLLTAQLVSYSMKHLVSVWMFWDNDLSVLISAIWIESGISWSRQRVFSQLANKSARHVINSTRAQHP